MKKLVEESYTFLQNTEDANFIRGLIDNARKSGSNSFNQQLNQALDNSEKNHTQKQINALESNFGTGGTDLTKKNKWG